MTVSRLLIANRGEIAIRIARAASELNLSTVAVYATDDDRCLHVRRADYAVALPGAGPAAYLDRDAIIAAALAAGCDAIHPGYGFLSENAEFARCVRAAGLVFVGPSADQLELFGDKAQARELARRCDVPVLAGTGAATCLSDARAFLAGLPAGTAIIVKAIAGGGGRGMRVVSSAAELDDAFARCESEAKNAFGNGALYVERLMTQARHIEVQVVGDGKCVAHLGERECTIQRRHQKLIERAPSPNLSAAMRERLCQASLRMAQSVGYQGLATFEFLVAPSSQGGDEFAFIEVNPRLQVEHTVTEQVTGVDLVKTQLRLAGGASLDELGLAGGAPAVQGHAIQLRVNMETITAQGEVRPSGGLLRAFDPPTGAGVRVDTMGYADYRTSPRYDSLLAKVIVSSASPDPADVLRRAARALSEFRIEGVATNLALLRRLVALPAFVEDRIHTRFVDEFIATLVDGGDGADAAGGRHEAARIERFFRATQTTGTSQAAGPRSAHGGDPLAVFGDAPGAAASSMTHAGPTDALQRDAALTDGPEGATAVTAPLQGTVVAIDVATGAKVKRGQTLLVLDAMKMEHPVLAPQAGTLLRLDVGVGEAVYEAAVLGWLQPQDEQGDEAESTAAVDLDLIRPDLRQALERRAELTDERRPDAVARRRKTGQRTTRENIDDLCDADSFVEYGGLVIAAQRQRRSIAELQRMSPADGMIAGHGTVNATVFGDEAARCAVLAYDYTVFAGTQGVLNHRKKDRLLSLCERWAMPLVVFAEGGGGRPGDEWPTPAGLDTTTFLRMGELSGLVPSVGLVSGRCFAGNAAMLGACDVIIAAANSNIGMGGPAMVEGGGLGVFRPEDIGPMSVQVPNGVVDIAVADEVQMVAAGKQYLGYFQGRTRDARCVDQRVLRHLIPENRLRAYDVRAVIDALADTGSVLELRPGFGAGMITSLIRLDGRPVGLIANDSRYLGGAIDADGADKAARLIRLCDAFDLPLISLCDTPGMMVGPEVEKTAQVRHVSRMFIAAANATVPILTVVLRKGYGLGALAMAGGSSQASSLIVAWPTAEFGPMGLEGGVKLAYRKELLAIDDPAQRKAWFDDKVAQEYEKNKALSSASHFEIDDVIDPAETRTVLLRSLRATAAAGAARRKKVASVDVW